MEENDFDISQLNEMIKLMRQKHSKSIRKISILNKEIKNLNDFKHELEARIRVMESTGIDKIKEDVHSLDNRLRTIETKHDNTKEKWRKIFDFAIQLVWVSMAAWLLTKLGLQPPL